MDPDGRDVVLSTDLTNKQRDFVVRNLARLHATPAGKRFLQRADRSKFIVTVGVARLPRRRIRGGTRVTGGVTRFGRGNVGDRIFLAAQSSDSPTAPPIRVLLDPSNLSDINFDPSVAFGHEFGGHLADLLNAAESNPLHEITGFDPNDESSSEAAEDLVKGKLPRKPSENDVKAVEKLLKPREEEKEIRKEE